MIDGFEERMPFLFFVGINFVLNVCIYVFNLHDYVIVMWVNSQLFAKGVSCLD